MVLGFWYIHAQQVGQGMLTVEHYIESFVLYAPARQNFLHFRLNSMFWCLSGQQIFIYSYITQWCPIVKVMHACMHAHVHLQFNAALLQFYIAPCLLVHLDMV